MAKCPDFFLRTDGLTGADAGGTWTNPSNNYSGALNGDNPSIKWDDLNPCEDTVFRYSGTSCGGATVTQDVILHKLDIGTVGATKTITICENGANVNIANELGAVKGCGATYAISGDIGDSQYENKGTSDVFDDEFNPSTAGTYNYTLTSTPNNPSGSTLSACCSGESATLTIIVESQFNAGTGGTYSAC